MEGWVGVGVWVLLVARLGGWGDGGGVTREEFLVEPDDALHYSGLVDGELESVGTDSDVCFGGEADAV